MTGYILQTFMQNVLTNIYLIDTYCFIWISKWPFWFHNLNSMVLFLNLNSMVPVKGIVLFNLVFVSHLLFSIHIAFGKGKYCSIVF